MLVKVINNSNNELPKYETSLSAGMDVRADFSRLSPQNLLKAFGDVEVIYSGANHVKTMVRMSPGARILVPTGIYMQLPDESKLYRYECQVRPRSGFALKKGLTVLNTPGTIDADYTSEIGIILINHGFEDVWIEDGERIAQLIFNKVEVCEWNPVGTLNITDRKGGFGSTN